MTLGWTPDAKGFCYLFFLTEGDIMVPDATAGELSTQYKGCNYDLAVLLEGEKPPATQEGLLVFGI